MAEADGGGRSAQERLQQITWVVDPELSSLGVVDLRHELLSRLQTVLAADAVMVWLSEDQGARQLVLTDTVGLAETARAGARVPVGRGFAGTVADQREPQVLDNGDGIPAGPLAGWEQGFGALLGVPILVGGQLLGVLQAGVASPRCFTEHERYLLQLAADRIAVHTQAETSRAEHTAAVTLARSLQPAQLPAPPGVAFAARYVPGHGTVGGDWYDVFPLPSGRIGIVIGDVAGSGLSAAAVMGRLRSALRAYALETEEPGEVLDKLDRKATHFETHTMTTVAYAVFDPARNELRISLAGHLAPVRALPGQPAALAELAVDPPLGFGLARHQRQTSVLSVPAGAAVCFYTDGLIERRDSTLDAGEDRLRGAVTAAPAESVCATAMSRLVGAGSAEDDVALLVLHRHPQTSGDTSDAAATGAAPSPVAAG